MISYLIIEPGMIAKAMTIIRARVTPLADVYRDRTFEIIGKGELLKVRLTEVPRALRINF